MADINEILLKYTSGGEDLEKTNAALEEAGTSFRLDPERNTLTETEIRNTTIGAYPDMANGWGLLDTGTGTLDKVHVTAGKLDYAVNEVKEDGSTSMTAYVLIVGKQYEVFCDRLGEVKPREPVKRKKIPNRPDMRRRSDLAGQEIVQHTKTGDYRICYDDFGYAGRAFRVSRENGMH